MKKIENVKFRRIFILEVYFSHTFSFSCEQCTQGNYRNSDLEIFIQFFFWVKLICIGFSIREDQIFINVNYLSKSYEIKSVISNKRRPFVTISSF